MQRGIQARMIAMVWMALGGMVLAMPANAQLLSTFVREQVGTLPQGRFMLSLVQVTSSIDRMYSKDGRAEPLSQNFNQDISFQKITQEETVRGSQLSGLFMSSGLSLSDPAGSVRGSLQGTVDAKVPVIGYGLTDQWGLFVTLPVLRFRLQSRYQFQPSAQTETFLQQLRDDNQRSVAREFEVALHTSLENKLYRSQYTWDPNLDKTVLGDAQVMLLRVYTSNETSGGSDPNRNPVGDRFVLQPMMTLPTSTDRDLQDLYGLRAGDQRFGLGLKLGAQRAFASRFQINLGFSGTYLFSATQSRRLAKSIDDDLREWMDPNTEVSGGSRWLGQAQLRYEFPKWVGLNLGMTWQKRAQETLRGGAFDAATYSLNSELTGEELISSYVSVDLNSISSFLEGQFLLPAVAEVGVGLPMSGRNALAEPVIQLQGSMFF